MTDQRIQLFSYTRLLATAFRCRRSERKSLLFCKKMILLRERTVAHLGWCFCATTKGNDSVALSTHSICPSIVPLAIARETRARKNTLKSQQVTCAPSSVLIVRANIFHIYSTHTQHPIHAMRAEMEQRTAELQWRREQASLADVRLNLSHTHTHTQSRMANIGVWRLAHGCTLCAISLSAYIMCAVRMTPACHRRHKSFELLSSYQMLTAYAWGHGKTMSWIMYERYIYRYIRRRQCRHRSHLLRRYRYRLLHVCSIYSHLASHSAIRPVKML